MINRESGVPIYIQIQELLEEMLQNGSLMPGDMLPSENELAEKLTVSRLTVRKSYVEMVKRGFFYTIQGKGTFVREHRGENFAVSRPNPSKDIIGVILPEVQGFYGDIFDGIREKCADLGLNIQLMFNNAVELEITSIRHLIGENSKGILISPSRHANTIIEHYQKLINSSVPTVMIGKPPFKIPASSISCDDVFGVYRAVEMLISHGNTQICYIKNSSYLDSASEERFSGYLAALHDYFPGDQPICMDLNRPTFMEDLKKAVRGPNPVTAFFCYCDAAAATVYGYLRQMGVSVPTGICRRRRPLSW
ncbi:MAG: GntR family transcriptional regulator [Clostridia bacterium]|nr:GntR family transcriptional regulator [Clostridia bacterium]